MSKPIPFRRLKTAVPMLSTDLRIGLFVSYLDCGWHNTPFLLEGILLTSEEEIATICGLTLRVTVDPTRSQLDAFPANYTRQLYEKNAKPLKVIASKNKQSTEIARQLPIEPGKDGIFDRLKRFVIALINSLLALAGDKPSKPTVSETRNGATSVGSLTDAHAAKAERFPRYLESVFATPEPRTGGRWRERLAAWLGRFRRKIGVGSAAQTESLSVPRPEFIPEEFDLVRHPDPEPTLQGVPKALAACEISKQVLVQIARDIRANGTIDVVSLQSAADTFAENMISRPATMMLAARMRDENDRVYQHGLGVAIYLTMLGRHLGLQREPLAELATIGMLLDLGKMDLDQTLLDKPGTLEDHEMKIMESHVEIGVENLRAGGVRSEVVLRAISDHHERIDGLGYPSGRAGDEVTIYGKMAAIADGFVAMVGPRPYAPTMSTYDALRSLFAEAGTRWHEPLVEQFVQSIGVFPVGSLIELSTGEVAIVIEDNKLRRLEPKILVLTDRYKKQLTEPWDLDMLEHNTSIAPKSIRILNGVADGAHGIDFREYYLRRS